MTVTAWVNPDYSSGSPEFTVVSKDKSFSLTISNDVSSENTAKFSVFDGIKWTAVESTSAITEDWSFLSSTFDGELIAIFVDGEREATQETIGVPTLTANGKLQTVSVENITSNEDIVIGASVTVKDSQPKSSNEFSGEIDDVSLYDYVLEDEQIFTMYEQTKDDYTTTLPELTLEEIIAQMELELANSENSTSTEIILDTNSTSTEIILDTNSTSTEPIIPEVTEIVSTEITLEHDEIEIGKTVTWTQTVTISDETDAVAIELPTDAEITKVITTDEQGAETILFEAEEISTSTGLVDDQDITQENIAELEIIEPTEIPVTTIITDDAKYIITEDATYVDLEEVETIEEQLIEEPIVTDQPLAKASQRTAPLAAPSVSQPNNSKMIDFTQLDTSSSTIVDAGQSDVVMSEKMIPIASLEEEMPELLQEEMPTKLLVVNNTSSEVDLIFETPAPYTTEQDQSTEDTYNKKVTVAHDSTLHYTNVKSSSDIPEDLVNRGVEFKLHWIIDGVKTDVTHDERFAVEYVDTNNNGIADSMQWIVPQLSEQEFEIEAEIVIINVQSYPIVGGNWTVNFTTVGTGDLVITAINETTFGESLPDDLKFLELNDGTQILTPIISGNTVTYPNYSSTEQGFETSQVLTSGVHNLMFEFGNDVGYANNNAGDAWCDISSTICDFDWKNRFEIVIDESLVTGSSDLSSFPMLVHISGTDFTNNLDDADDSINDIRFTNKASTTLLDYEIVTYDKTGNEMIAFVEIPTLDYNDDTTIYMYFDNAGFAN